jgi:diacylglycerol O-acyltransferase-1
MALTVDSATATARESPAEAPIKRSGHSHVSLNGLSTIHPLEPVRARTKKKYRHIAAVHSMPRASCLSHDSEAAPSFLGFRNLMVIVLSMSAKHVSLSDSALDLTHSP